MALAALATLAMPAPAPARNIGSDDEIVLTGTVRIPRGEHADRILIADGRVEIAGHVDGVVLALDAPVHIARTAVIDGNVISLSKRVTVARGATLNHDLIYADEKPVVREGAMVYGDTRRVDAGDVSLPLGAFVVHLAIWLTFTLSSLALGLGLVWLAPRAVEAVSETARERAGPAIAWGVGLFLGLPVVAIAAVLTLVGIALGLLVLLALLPLYALGYVITAYVLGRAIVPARGRALAFLMGWAILRVIAFIPGLGVLAWIGATVFGLGTMTVALWRTRGSGTRSSEPDPAATAA